MIAHSSCAAPGRSVPEVSRSGQVAADFRSLVLELLSAKRITARDAARLQTGHEPMCALCRSAVGK